MPQCKRDGCREAAVKVGKRYCPRHMADYKAKQAAHYAKPKCTDCGTHTSRVQGDYQGDPVPGGLAMCGACQKKRYDNAMEQRARERELAEARDMQARRNLSLDAAETVDDLRQFIKDWILEDRKC